MRSSFTPSSWYNQPPSDEGERTWGCEKHHECLTRVMDPYDPNRPRRCKTHGLLIQTMIPEGES
jgi:hypothetical protein